MRVSQTNESPFFCHNVVATTSPALISTLLTRKPDTRSRSTASHPCLVESAKVSEGPAASFSVEYGDTGLYLSTTIYGVKSRKRVMYVKSHVSGNIWTVKLNLLPITALLKSWNISWPNALLCTWSRSQEWRICQLNAITPVTQRLKTPPIQDSNTGALQSRWKNSYVRK